jgi:L-glutamine-phosphate cytidylyltransferase
MNAIILAAGMGTRLMPLTKDRPKALVEVAGKAIIETQIEHLLAAGVSEVVIVGGHYQEKLLYLQDKYPRGTFTFLKSTCYPRHNNFCSMYAAREFLGETYVLEGDVFLPKNILLHPPERSSYFIGLKQDAVNEWAVSCDTAGRINAMTEATGAHRILAGVSCWRKPATERIKHFLEEYRLKRDFAGLYWDQVVRDHLDAILVYGHPIEAADWHEIDSPADLGRAAVVRA